MNTTRMAATLAAAALLLTAACGGEEAATGTDTAASPSVAAPSVAAESSAPAEPTEASPSAEPSAEETSEGAEVDPQAFGQALIDAQLEAGTVHMTGKFGPEATMTAVMSFTGGAPAMDMKLSGPQPNNRAHVILLDGTMYLQISGAGMGEKYLELDSKALGDNNPLAQTLESVDPSTSFKAFKAITSLERVGQETVDGAATTHYEVTVDTAKSLQAQGIDPNQAGPLPPEVRYDLWVGEDDLIRKMVMGPEAGGIEMVLSEWGEPVQISAPSPNKIQQMPRG